MVDCYLIPNIACAKESSGVQPLEAPSQDTLPVLCKHELIRLTFINTATNVCLKEFKGLGGAEPITVLIWKRHSPVTGFL